MDLNYLYHQFVRMQALYHSDRLFWRHFDRRKASDKKTIAAFIEFKKAKPVWADIQAYLLKIKARRAQMWQFKPLFENPLWLDYKNNKPTRIYPDHLNFGQRNHWAQSRQDFNVLRAILKNKK